MKTKFRTALRDHNKAIHEGIPYHYEKREKTTRYKSSLTEHKRNVTEHKRNVHDRMINECKKCDYKSKYCSSLRDHVKAVHEGIVYECEKCDYSAKSKPSIREHKKAVHEGVLHNTLHHPTGSPTNQSGAAVLIVGIWPLMNTWHEDSNTFQHASKLSLPPPNDKEFKLGGGNDLLSGKKK